MNTIPIKISSSEANLATSALIGSLYAAYGEDPLRWKKMDNHNKQTIDFLQNIHDRLEYFTDPWESDVDYFSVTVREARLMRLCFRVFSNCFSSSSQEALQEIFSKVDDVKLKGKGMMPGFRKMDDRLASLIKKANG